MGGGASEQLLLLPQLPLFTPPPAFSHQDQGSSHWAWGVCSCSRTGVSICFTGEALIGKRVLLRAVEKGGLGTIPTLLNGCQCGRTPLLPTAMAVRLELGSLICKTTGWAGSFLGLLSCNPPPFLKTILALTCWNVGENRSSLEMQGLASSTIPWAGSEPSLVEQEWGGTPPWDRLPDAGRSAI